MVFLSNVAGFLGMMKALGFSVLMLKLRLRTSLCPSLATTASASGVRSKYIPFITGRISSLAVAKSERVMLSLRMAASTESEVASSANGLV